MAKIKDVRNIIGNNYLIETIKREFKKVLVDAPEKRRKIEAEWLEFKNIFTMQHDRNKEIFRGKYTSLSKMPTPRRSINRIVEVIEKNLFPYTRAIEGMPLIVRAEGEDDESYKQRLNQLKAAVKRHGSLIEYQLFELNKIRKRARPIILQYLLYDLGVAKVGPKLHTQQVFANNQIGLRQMIMPSVAPVDIFRWYVWPDAISEKEQAKWIYEWSVQRTSFLKLQENLGHYRNIDKALSKATYDSMFDTTTQEGGYQTHLGADVGARANRKWYRRYQGNVNLDNSFFKKDGGYVFVFDGYYKEDIEYYDGNGKFHPKDGVLETVNFVFVNGEIVMAKLVEEDPYLDCRSNGLPNEYYQQPKMRSIHRLLYMEESAFSQFMEHLSRLGGIIHILDPNSGVNQVEDFKPERVLSLSPQMYQQHHVQDNTRGFLVGLGQIEAIIREELSDVPATEAKMGTPGRAQRTKGGMEMMAEKAAFASLRETMNLEDRIFKPILEQFYKMNRNIDSDMFIQTGYGGPEGELSSSGYGYENIIVTPSDIKTAANFKWLGSMRVMSEARLADGLRELIMASSKYPEELVKIDHVTLLRMWVEQGLGIKNGDAIIQEPDQQQSIPLPLLAQFFGQMFGNEEQAKQMLQQLMAYAQQAKAQNTPENGGVKSMNTEALNR